MVMEKPSAQLVGREFVRQYYTLLNQAPDYLHRFYGKNSSYVHGGLDSNGKPVEAVYGQSEIHKRVMALSFRDCHTKIRHVDAHATLNEGVVVQVMGELSNNMQPMRKFMQTFVLAPEVSAQAQPEPPARPAGTVANKFYVHNDVFRYQDEVFGDSDSEPPEGRVAPAGPAAPGSVWGGGGGGPRGPPPRGGMAQKPSFGSGRGSGPSEGRYPAPRQ
ncbi:unnamed protein product [Menidia menidia]|uniref:(Atlantic silverside) hypothetical protein n=1 Tax=Menidia menidia TaxID=238744 RepID=A0A8S4BIV4_9TELE|nr:unnamed protein product [Menidia menidia]